MRRVIALLASTAALAVPAFAAAPAPSEGTTESTTQCAHRFTGAEHRRLVDRSFTRLRIVSGGRDRHQEMLRCPRSASQRKSWRADWRAAKRRLHWTRKIETVTPFGPYAIPAWCVMLESGGSWGADNPISDARGLYQLLDHGEPWPVDSIRDKYLHHAIAFDLSDGGYNLDPWVAC